jgi:insulysin
VFEGFAYGNLRQKPVIEAAKVLRQKLAGKPLPETERFRESVIQIPSGKSHAFTRKMQVENSALVLETQIGQLSPKLQGALLLIDNLIQPQFYNELRTSQQLGYIVNSGMTLLEETLGLVFMVQSGEYDTEILEKRIYVFLLNFFESLKELSEKVQKKNIDPFFQDFGIVFTGLHHKY